MSKDISSLRKDYVKFHLEESQLKQNPIEQFLLWWEDVLKTEEEPNAMILSTVDADFKPQSRVLLLKKVSEKGFSFFTNYKSHKAIQLSNNPNACILFFWQTLERQVKINGLVHQLTREENEYYFNSRPFESRVGAVVSEQSQKVLNRKQLEQDYQNILQQYQHQPDKLLCPQHWGGYCLEPETIEFWQGRISRLHDRFFYEKNKNGEWVFSRLSP